MPKISVAHGPTFPDDPPREPAEADRERTDETGEGETPSVGTSSSGSTGTSKPTPSRPSETDSSRKPARTTANR